MVINDTDIAGFGMKVLGADGYLDHPKRKRILAEPKFLAKDLKFEEFEVTFRLMCKQATVSGAATAIGNLKTLLQTKAVHRFRDFGRGIDFKGVVKEGLKVDAHGNHLVITLKITATECITGNLIT